MSRCLGTPSGQCSAQPWHTRSAHRHAAACLTSPIIIIVIPGFLHSYLAHLITQPLTTATYTKTTNPILPCSARCPLLRCPPARIANPRPSPFAPSPANRKARSQLNSHPRLNPLHDAFYLVPNILHAPYLLPNIPLPLLRSNHLHTLTSASPSLRDDAIRCVSLYRHQQLQRVRGSSSFTCALQLSSTPPAHLNWLTIVLH